MSTRIDVPDAGLRQWCHRHAVRRLAFFGSVLRDDFSAQSDVDVLVEFEPEAHGGLLDLCRMQTELGSILGRNVDFVDRAALENSRNYIRRQAVLATAQTFYAAR